MHCIIPHFIATFRICICFRKFSGHFVSARSPLAYARISPPGRTFRNISRQTRTSLHPRDTRTIRTRDRFGPFPRRLTFFMSNRRLRHIAFGCSRSIFDGERESKHPADFSKTPDDGGHDEDDDDDDIPRPSGSGGASSSRRPGGPAGGNMGGGPGMGGRGGAGSGMGPRTSSLTNSSSGGRLSASIGLEHLERTPLSLPSHISTSFPGHYPPSQSFPHGGHGGLSHSSFSAMHSQHPSLSTHSQSHNYAQSPTSAYPGPGSALPVSGERHSPFNFNLPQKRARLDSSASATSTGGGSSYPGGPTAYTIDDPTAHQAYLQSQGQGQGSGTPQPQFGLHFGRPTPSPSSTGGRALYGQGQASPPPSNASSTPSNANSFVALMPGAGGGGISPTSPHHPHRPSAGGVGDLDWPIHNASQSQSQVQTQMHSRPGGGTDSAWLDFLSSAPASGSAPGAGASASSDGGASSAPSNASSAGGSSSAASSSSTTTLTSNASTLGKRSRSDSYLEDRGESSGRVKEEDRNEGGATMRRSGGQELDIFASTSSATGRERKTSDVRTGAGDVNTGSDWLQSLMDLDEPLSSIRLAKCQNPRPASVLVFAAPGWIQLTLPSSHDLAYLLPDSVDDLAV
ncbi:hypothetical protein A7U60_g5231 [Sanghuangporus baumii]|uniref:Uncharacterized protein n=1 Tax=Sanghuangporus baumii TaxID=108892 RepID=A0A9Q5N405_SANBA|nr:hypothetical protein A7U60_g5231 [Sanghuangporus baumii]